MRSIKQTLLACTITCALGAVATATAPASTLSLFLSHPTGKLSAVAGGSQVFTTAAGSLVCNAFILNAGAAATLRSLAILVTGQYEQCEIFGQFVATVHPFEYSIDANGIVALENTTSILVPGDECTITIPASQNQSLSTVKFDNNTNGTLLVLWRLGNIASSGAGVGCSYAEESEGTLEGKTKFAVEGGALGWEQTLDVLSTVSPTLQFLSHPSGNKLLGTVGGVGQLQLFRASSADLRCTGLKLAEGTSLLASKIILVTIQYENCTMFGLTATAHPFKYLINADGYARLENTVLILANNCTIRISTAKNQTLKTIKFVTDVLNASLLLLWDVTKITSSGSGSACTYAEESNGIFEGRQRFFRNFGVVKWDA